MKKTIMDRLQEFLKQDKFLKQNMLYLPSIRYFDGTNSFSDISGKYKAKSLEDSLDLFLKENGY